MRAALIHKKLITAKVFENAAGFIYIKYEEKETDPLDSTRIHPELYEMAQKIARSALDLPEDHKEDEVIARIMRDPSYLKELELQFYANQLEQTKGRESMIKVLDFISNELTHPFFTEKRLFEEPSGLELLYLVSGESPSTLCRGKLVQCTIISYDDRSQSLIVKLESGLKGSIEKSCICEGQEPSKEEMKSFNKGMSLTARVLEVLGKLGKPGESDVFFRIRLSVLPQDLTDHKRFLKLELDPAFKEIEEDWNEKTGLEDDEYRQGQKYVPRVVNHPKFKNVGLKTCCEELKNRDIGDCIFRPSSRGQDHLTCT
jgi:Transcriptional accessory protein